MSTPMIVRPETTLVVLLGAESWPNWPEFDTPAFRRSVERFRRYLRERLNLPEKHLRDLFNDPSSPDEIVREVQQFIKERTSEAPAGAPRPTDLLLYYVGHGTGTAEAGYRLAIRRTSKESANSSSLAAYDLVEAIERGGHVLRTYLILDACFSGSITDALRWPVGSRGLTLLASASREDVAKAPREEGVPMFSDALLDVLEHGDPKLDAWFSLRTLQGLTEQAIKSRFGEAAVRPEVHSPYQRQGDLADVSLFPNHASLRWRGRRPDGQAADPKSWCAVISQADHPSSSDGGADENGPFRDVLESFNDSYRADIGIDTQWNLSDEPKYLDAGRILGSVAELRAAVDTVCRADLAFFDLTDFEPAAMLLLGIRSVVRRGITICSVRREAQLPEDAELPFHLKEISVSIHSSGRGDQDMRPEKRLAERVTEGIRQLDRAPGGYLDLPSFDLIRQISPDPDSRKIRPYDERVLVLCPFSEKYSQRNWGEIRHRLYDALKFHISNDSALGRSREKRSPRIQRTLDMQSPRVVSSALFEAIRLTDFCLCDLTEWRPNVLFELGVRLAANELHPVCILEQSDGGPRNEDSQPTRLDRIAEQCEQFAALFPILRYEPRDRMVYREMVRRHLEYRDQLRKSRTVSTWIVAEKVPAGSLYYIAWQHASRRYEPAATPVEKLLEESADALMISTSVGNNPFVYPPAHEMTEAAQETGRERLIAAWLYLHHRVGREYLSTLPATFNKYVEVGTRLYNMLAGSPDEADKQFANEIFRHVTDLEGVDEPATNREQALHKVQTLQSRAKAHTRRKEWPSAEAVLRRAIDELKQALQAGGRETGETGPSGSSRNEIARALADSYGMLGGVYRRQALLLKAIEAYTSGREVEQDEQYDIIDSYNLTNSVVLPVVVEPTRLNADLPEIQRAADVLKGQVQGKRRDQWWAWADLGLLALLSEQQEVADDAYRQFRRNGARASDFDSTIAVIQECQEALQRAHPAVAERLQTTIVTLRANMPNA